MKPAPFEYFVPKTTDETLSLLSEHGFDAKILAGGQSLVPTMNFRLAQPAVLIDINYIQDLSFIEKTKTGGLHIGAMTRQVSLEFDAVVAETSPLISETMPHIAHPQIRNRGTLGGSLVHADPSAELPAVMVALDAKFKLKSQAQERWVVAKDFFIDLFMTVTEPEELLTEIEVPALPDHSGYAFKEVARRHGDFALAGAATVLRLDKNQQCQDVRIVLMSVGGGPVQATEAGAALIGEKPTEKIILEAAEIAAEKDIDPPADMHASVAFRRHLTKILARDTLRQAAARAGAQL